MNNSFDRRAMLGVVFTDAKFIQYLMTLLTGKALDQQRLPRVNPYQAMAIAVGALLLGIIGGFWSAGLGHWLGLLPSWLLTLYGARYLQLVIVHNASHRNFVRKKVVDQQVGFWTSTLLLIENFEHYGPKHADGHHSWHKLSTDLDPTVQSLAEAGICAGFSRLRLLVNLVLTLVNPWYHLKAFWRRLQSYYVAASWKARVTMTGLLAMHIALLIGLSNPMVFVLAWVVPITVLYQQVTLLRLVVEHHWQPKDSERTNRAASFPLTKAIFVGAEPPLSLTPWAWSLWGLNMLAALMVRLVILPGDSGAAHDLHHIHPRGDWPNYIAERRDQASKHPERYQEVWGYWNALQQSLKSISQA